MLGVTALAGGLVGLAMSYRNLPDVRSLKGYVPSETTYIYDINGKVLASLHGEENREVRHAESRQGQSSSRVQ
jgi:penicillin-binding protein 1A